MAPELVFPFYRQFRKIPPGSFGTLRKTLQNQTLLLRFLLRFFKNVCIFWLAGLADSRMSLSASSTILLVIDEDLFLLLLYRVAPLLTLLHLASPVCAARGSPPLRAEFLNSCVYSSKLTSPRLLPLPSFKKQGPLRGYELLNCAFYWTSPFFLIPLSGLKAFHCEGVCEKSFFFALKSYLPPFQFHSNLYVTPAGKRNS